MNGLLRGIFGVGIVVAIAAGFSAAHAEDAVKERQKLMKSVGAQMKILAPMVAGEVAYDAVAAEAALRTINAVPAQFITLFPDGSDLDPGTEAAPKIWEDRAGFEARAKDLETLSAAALTKTGQGLDAFKPAFGQMAGACKACHDSYRIKTQ